MRVSHCFQYGGRWANSTGKEISALNRLIRTAAIALVPALLSGREDERIERLERFFAERPAHVFAKDFLAQSDQYGLDWRLLPALCVIETSGGLHVRSRNNWFGWDSGRARFPTILRGIHTVAQQLAE